MSATWYNLKRDLIDNLNNQKEEFLDSQYPEDLLYEIVDATIPCNYNDLAALLADNHDLGYVHDSGLVDTKETSVFKIIQVSIYEQLSEIAYEWLQENRLDMAA